AVTFTNKATQEMKDRILSYLQELADGRQGIIYKSLTKETGWGAKTIQEKAKNSLSNILHEYSHFSVSTIDSFFQKVIRAFAKEMGLQSAFTIELDVQKALDYAIDQLMLDISDDQSLAKWLIEFSESRMDVGKSWDIRKEINKLGYQLFSEEFKKYEKELLAVAKNRRELKEYFLEIEAIRSGFVDHLSSIGKKAIDIIENNDLSIDDFTYKSTGMMGYFLRLADKKSLEPGTRARKSLESFTWCGAKHPKKDFIESLVQQSLHPLMQEAIEYYDTHIISYSTADSILKYFYTFGIMADLIDKLDHYRREEAVMLISDVNGFLKDVIGGNDAPFIYEKVGSFYRHFMIDEFQDTSGFQWDNFLPLIQNNLAEGRKNLVVGDVKQSIYRWRGGDWQLLLEGVVADVGRNYAQEIDLTDNWRSQPEVISFNNALFSISPIILSRQYVLSLDFEVDPKFIIQAYAQAIQNIPPSNSTESSRGYVSVNFLEEDKELDISWKDLAIKQTVRDIEDAQDRGVPLKEIAVLVRRNSEGKLIADALLEKQSLKEDNNYRYDVISPDSLFISGSKAVKIVISCLRFLSNREDMLSLAQLVYDYAAFSETVESDTIFESNVQLIADEVIPKEILDENNELIRLPVFDLCEKLIAYFDLGAKEGEISYLQGFQEAVLDFTREGNDDTGAFLEWWETYGVTRSVQIPESLDAIRIMTVHKSKGLQFGSVLVPFCNWAFDHSASNERIMWLKPASEPFNKLPLLPVKYGNNLVQTEFVQDFAKERLRSYLDNLNLLYVAFTRAENELFAYAPLPKQLRNGGWPFRRGSYSWI
ncbi:MAG: UvrD-helicase domain-containing protein, partial [Bacteroidota bacterium]